MISSSALISFRLPLQALLKVLKVPFFKEKKKPKSLLRVLVFKSSYLGTRSSGPASPTNTVWEQ